MSGGIKPQIWGKPGWDFIHMITLNYPENPTLEDKQRYLIFLSSLQYVLPCDECRQNMSKHLQERPINTWVLANKENMVKWGIDLHNLVNRDTGKQILTYDQALDYLDSLINPVPIREGFAISNNTSLIIAALVFIIAIAFIYYFLKHRK